MALVHRADDNVSPAIRYSDNLAEKLRADKSRAEAIAKFTQNLINAEIKSNSTGEQDAPSQKPSPD